MPAVDEVVTTEIEIKDAAVTQTGFGTPCLVGYHTFWPDLVRTFSDPDEMTEAPFLMPTDHPIYLAALVLCSQQPRPPQFKVGKRLGQNTQTVRLTPGTPAEGDVYSIEVDGALVSVTAGPAPTVATIVTALTAAIDGLPTSDADAADEATHVTVTGAPGAMHRFDNPTSNLAVKDLTVDSTIGIATDLAAIRAYDADWYWLVPVDFNNRAQLLLAAAWAETELLLMSAVTQDSEAYDAGVSDDVASALETAGYHRTFTIWHGKPETQFANSGWVGRVAPKAPGSYTAANKSLAGVDKSPLNDTQRGALKGKNCNYYVDVKGVGFTLDGRAASGRYIDITHGVDWFSERTKERIVYVLANNDKVPYTDKGISLFGAQVEAQILDGIGVGLIDGAAPWSVTVPKAAEVNPNDRTQRFLPDVRFQFVLAGAVHKVQVKGTVRTTVE